MERDEITPRNDLGILLTSTLSGGLLCIHGKKICDGRCFDCRTNRPLWRETVEIDVLKTVNSGITHPTHPQQHLHRRSNDVGANGRLVVVPVRETPAEFRNRGDIEFALHYIEERNFGSLPETIHEEVSHLLRLLVANIQGEYLTRVSQTK